MVKIRVLIVETNPDVRAKIRNFLKDEPDFDIVGEPETGSEAVSAIMEQKPDLIFFNREIPAIDSREVLKALEINRVPHEFLVMVYNHSVLHSFKVNVMDFLSNPFDSNRFKRALFNAKKHISGEKTDFAGIRPEVFLDSYRKKYPRLKKLMINSGEKLYFLPVDEIYRFEATENCVIIHTKNDTHSFHETISGLEEKLDGSKFVRINSSIIVHIEKVRELREPDGGSYLLIFKNGTRLPLEQKGYDKILNLFEQLS